MSCSKCDKNNETRRLLEDIQDRACKEGLPEGIGLTEFTEYIRGLYPELYMDKTAENKEFSDMIEEETEQNIKHIQGMIEEDDKR